LLDIHIINASLVTRDFEDLGVLEGIYNVEITVWNLDKAVEFYTKKFDLKPVNKITQRIAGHEKGQSPEKSNTIIANLQAGKDIFELIQYTNREGESCEAIPWNTVRCMQHPKSPASKRCMKT
jgi:hypothetical protein